MSSNRSPSSNMGVSELPKIQKLIQDAYEYFWFDHDWPHLKMWSDKLTQAGERYYDCPADIDFERFYQIETKNGGLWTPCKRGITIEDYNSYDSDEDVRADPIMAWDERFTDTDPQIEIWPIPATDDLSFRFAGYKKFAQLVNTGDKCLLDSILIEKSVSAQLLAGSNATQALSNLRGSEAGKRYAALKGKGQADTPDKISFAGSGQRSMDRGPIQIRIIADKNQG